MRAQFEIEESSDLTGSCVLVLRGELDMSVAEQLEARLADLKAAEVPVHLDLSQLTFIDSSGIRVVILARLASERNGWTVEVERNVPAVVRGPLELLGLDEILWSQSPD
jgi:anti-anti-sigma factor